MRNFLAKLLVICGLLMIMGAAGLAVYNVWDGNRAARASDEIVEKLEEELQAREDSGDTDASGENASGTDTAIAPGAFDGTHLYEQYPDMDMPSVEINGYRYIGILEVPSLNLKLPVMEEWDYTRLKISPCRYSGSVYLRNMVIAGHNYAKHFSPLKYLPEGTEIIFTDMSDNVFNYKIAWTEVIEPSGVETMTEKTKDSDDWDMTLFTCTTGGSARCAIRCVIQDTYDE